MRGARVLAALFLGACVSAEDNPTTVKDLRVLGIAVEPPELLVGPRACSALTQQQPALSPELALALLAQLEVTALLADPAGRSIDYELRACAGASEHTCADAAARLELASGSAHPGARSLYRGPIGTDLNGVAQLLEAVWNQDPYKGLGGLRVPLVLHVRAGEEEVYAEKLAVFGCQFFPDMRANQTPRLPGLSLEGTVWPEDFAPLLSGKGPFMMAPEDLSALEEDYVVPSFRLEPVALRESWKISWYTDLGRLSPAETGGTDVGGSEGRHRVAWAPPATATEQEVTFWAVVRDGRGGESWLIRRAQHRP